jgi:photosystem II stability/assembly factor-like uncharacterized protein
VADGWRALAGSPQSPGTARHDDLVFVDEQRGWLVNVRGEVHATTDGGQTWQRLVQFTDVVPRAIAFVSGQVGFLGNINRTSSPVPDAALFETLDAGRTWTNVSSRIAGPPVVGICGMRALSPSRVVAVGRWSGPAVFVQTRDGGRSWTSHDLTDLASGLVDVAFLDEERGIAVGSLGDGPTEAQQQAARVVVLATTDGGETWQRRYLGPREGERAWKVHFVDTEVGFVSIEGARPEGVVLRTQDGGQSWERLPVAPGLSFQAVGFVSRERGWLGSRETLYSTRDGGASWQPIGLGTFTNRIRILSPQRAFAAGDRVYSWEP